MKKIIILCMLLALLAPVDVFARGGGNSNRLTLDVEWRHRQAQMQRRAAHFRAIEADAARAIEALTREAETGRNQSMYRFHSK